MINNLKWGFKVLSYGYGIRMSLIQGAVFTLIGILFFVEDTTSPGSVFDGGMPGEFMFICMAMLPAQVIYSLSAANMVQTSPMKKKLQTAIPAAITWAGMTFLYLIVVLIRAVTVFLRPERLYEVCNGLIVLGITIVMLMLYIGVVYKYFLSTLCFILLFFYFGVFKGAGFITKMNLWGQEENIFSFVTAAVIGLVCIVAGALGQYLLSLLVYKAPMSKMAMASPLRKEL